MGTTTFSGPITAGTKKDEGETNGPNLGYVILTQKAGFTQNSTTAVSNTFYVPKGAVLIDVLFDIETAFDSATSATGSVGKTAGGTEYASGVNCKAATGRIRPTFTAAQLAAMKNQSVLGVAVSSANENEVVVATITPVGATTAGYVEVTLVYAQV